MKMTRRNFISASAATMLACGVSLSAHAAGSEAENNSLNFIADFFSDPSKPGTTQDATSCTAEKNAEWYSKLDFPTGGSLPTQSAACWTIRKAGSFTTVTDQRRGICKTMAIWIAMRRIRSIQACGGTPSSTQKPDCLRSATASIRCAVLTWPTRLSSAPTTAGSSLMS